MKFTITDKPRLMWWITLLGIVAVVVILCFLVAGCASGERERPAYAEKLDRLAGIWLTYDGMDPQAQADFKEATLMSLLAEVGVTAEALSDVVPTASGIVLAKEFTQDRPEWAEHEALLAKLYTFVVYGG